MIQAILDMMGASAHFVWDILCALAHFGWGLLSAVAAVLSWPVKAALGLLRTTLSWTPLFAGLCLVLAVLLSALCVLALVCTLRRRRR